MNGVVIVGAGLAGSRCAEALRAGGCELPSRVVGAERVAPYERPALSKEFLAGTRSEADLLPASPGLLGRARHRPQARHARRARRPPTTPRPDQRARAPVDAPRARDRSPRPLASRCRLPERPSPEDAGGRSRAPGCDPPRLAARRRRRRLRRERRSPRRRPGSGRRVTIIEAETAPLARVAGAEVGHLLAEPLAGRRSRTSPGGADRAGRARQGRPRGRNVDSVRHAARGGRSGAGLEPALGQRRDPDRRVRADAARPRVRLRRRGAVRRPPGRALDERLGAGGRRRLGDPRLLPSRTSRRPTSGRISSASGCRWSERPPAGATSSSTATSSRSGRGTSIRKAGPSRCCSATGRRRSLLHDASSRARRNLSWCGRGTETLLGALLVGAVAVAGIALNFTLLAADTGRARPGREAEPSRGLLRADRAGHRPRGNDHDRRGRPPVTRGRQGASRGRRQRRLEAQRYRRGRQTAQTCVP